MQQQAEQAEELECTIQKLTEKADHVQAELLAVREALAAAEALTGACEAAASQQESALHATIARLEKQVKDERLKVCPELMSLQLQLKFSV